MTSKASMQSDWLIRCPSNGAASIRLICFPFAGGGGYFYRTWGRDLNDQAEVYAVQPPGRENRISEDPIASMRTIVQKVVAELTPLLDQPFAFLGHSFGAALAYDAARELRRQRQPLPAHLFVSAIQAPQLPCRDSLHTLGEAEFAQAILQLGGTPEAILADRDMRAMMLHLLRADLTALETREHVEDTPLSCPITAFGSPTDVRTTREELLAWKEQTCESFSLYEFEGGHFYLKDPEQRRKLLNTVEIILRSTVPQPK
ncbi:MAG TPA: alpha/beta fold hydrolase [Planktothrix sp.]